MRGRERERERERERGRESDRKRKDVLLKSLVLTKSVDDSSIATSAGLSSGWRHTGAPWPSCSVRTDSSLSGTSRPVSFTQLIYLWCLLSAAGAKRGMRCLPVQMGYAPMLCLGSSRLSLLLSSKAIPKAPGVPRTTTTDLQACCG